MRRIYQLIFAVWAIALVLALIYLTADSELITWAYWEQDKRSEIVRNLGLLAAAVVGVGFAIWRAITGHVQAKASLAQARTAESGHITDRFTRAVDQLGSEQLPVRLGAIYALWRLAEDWPDQYTTTVVDILCAFVRNPPHPTTFGVMTVSGTPTDLPIGQVRPDVQAILDLIGGKSTEYRNHLPEGYQLNLEGAYLVEANLRGANLEHVILDNANPTQAGLAHVNLKRSRLANADLTDANLAHSNLGSAFLHHASLQRANMQNANLEGSLLVGVNLSHAGLLYANLERARLFDADFTGANLDDAILKDADFTGANLVDASLTDANLTGADLETAKNLTQAQLDSACVTTAGAPPKLPEGLNPPTKICGKDT